MQKEKMMRELETKISEDREVYVQEKQKKDDLKVNLGKKLFYDPILSNNLTVSCASCHLPQFSFSDTVALSKGINNKTKILIILFLILNITNGSVHSI